MNKKGSMELSVNSIVILVIAIVMLGLILGFVKSKFSDLNKQVTTNEPDPATATPGNPLTISRTQLVVSAGDTTYLKFGVFGTEAFSSADLSLMCDNQEWLDGAPQVDVDLGETTIKSVVVAVPSTNNDKGKKICTATVDGKNSIDVLVEVI